MLLMQVIYIAEFIAEYLQIYWFDIIALGFGEAPCLPKWYLSFLVIFLAVKHNEFIAGKKD